MSSFFRQRYIIQVFLCLAGEFIALGINDTLIVTPPRNDFERWGNSREETLDFPSNLEHVLFQKNLKVLKNEIMLKKTLSLLLPQKHSMETYDLYFLYHLDFTQLSISLKDLDSNF